MELLTVVIAVILGLIFGSFFNVCIYRIPRDLSVVSPPSHCPNCGRNLPFWLNVPLLTYVFLRGRCWFCHKSISLQYPLVEALTGLLFGAAAFRFGLSPSLVGALLLISLLVPITFIDLEHQIIPDRFSLAGIVIGLAGAWWWLPMPWWESLLGALLGWFSLWLVATGYYYSTGRDGMGGGDLKLLAMLGAFLGYKALLPIILLSSLSGAVIGLGLVFWKGKDGRYAIPFGPFLAVGGLIYLFYGPEIIAFYWELMLPS